MWGLKTGQNLIESTWLSALQPALQGGEIAVVDLQRSFAQEETMAEEEMSFHFPELPDVLPGKRMTVKEAEQVLLRRIWECRSAWRHAVCELLRFYRRNDGLDEAIQYTSQLLNAPIDLEERACYLLNMGQMMEQREDFTAAIYFYQKAYSLEPVDENIWYLINNNLGYCLNHFGRHVEAEPYCREAIKVDPTRFNAHKNLGISLQGQGKYAEAARCYLQSVQYNAGDPRAYNHLEQLVAEHPEVLKEMPDLERKMEKCRAAVDLFERKRRDFMEKLEKDEEPNQEKPDENETKS
jgi:tetratricopeptide (TPR) repeat protein